MHRPPMEATYTAPSILRLPGVSQKDYDEMGQMFDAQFSGAEVDEVKPHEDEDVPDQIPKVFTSLDDWPLKTNLVCWDMHGHFDNRPVFIPTNFAENENGVLEIGVKGNFATFNNAARYILIHYTDREEKHRAIKDLCILYKIFTGKSIRYIPPAPSCENKKRYGGLWDEDTYWKKLRELDPIYGLNDHTPGSIKTERERIEPPNMWSICDLASGDDETAEQMPFDCKFMVEDIYA